MVRVVAQDAHHVGQSLIRRRVARVLARGAVVTAPTFVVIPRYTKRRNKRERRTQGGAGWVPAPVHDSPNVRRRVCLERSAPVKAQYGIGATPRRRTTAC
jgi:hypothetical protein